MRTILGCRSRHFAHDGVPNGLRNHAIARRRVGGHIAQRRTIERALNAVARCRSHASGGLVACGYDRRSALAALVENTLELALKRSEWRIASAQDLISGWVQD